MTKFLDDQIFSLFLVILSIKFSAIKPMFKRKREPVVLVASHRPRTSTNGWQSSSSSSSDAIAHTRPPSILGKRSYEPENDLSRKRPFLFDAPHGQKRAADFDFEIERLSKRLRATTPTAEEALGFLLPHLLEMRRLYLGERQKVNALQEDNRILKQNNTVITQALRDQLTKKSLVQRQLDLALYRLALVPDGNSF
mgnify:CR=1 FL=1